MSDELRDPRFCLHDQGTMVFLGVEGPLCGDCHTPMVWVARSVIETYERVLAELRAVIEELRAQR